MACGPGQECYMEPGSTFAKPLCRLKCGPNEALSMCEDTCVTKDKPIQRLCSNENICACKEGYVRDKQTRQCIPSDQCSSTTTRKPTGSTGTTTRLTGSTGTRTTETGTTTARNARTSGTPTTATPTCCENEMLKRCSGCEATCAFPAGCPKCVPNCQQAKCECKPGFVRCPISGRCICASLCPKNSCPPNEDWHSCPTCEATCTNLNPICPMVCKTPACQCCKGYVRCPISGRCVTPASCPKINPLTHPKVRVAAQIMPRMVQVQQSVSQKQPAALKKPLPKFVVQRQAPVG
ncbi:unnamed protein product, partial [Mesorhabditis belari]|uniref:TIL domain-containing protein n=1 Tax=Mesorhabditis belari TaxID=2138241 RepID=A0AAF3ELH9_9BILA